MFTKDELALMRDGLYGRMVANRGAGASLEDVQKYQDLIDKVAKLEETPFKGFYQVLSRKNDVNGNPYRLGIVYEIIDGRAKVTRMIQERSSMPNFKHFLYKEGFQEIETYSLTPSEYNDTRKYVSKAAKVEVERS